jgi:hypothetical protein
VTAPDGAFSGLGDEMKLIVAAVGLAALAGGQFRAERDFPVTRQDSIERTLRFAGSDVHTLDVRVVNGSIQVTGDGGNEVRLRIDRTIETEREQFIEDARRDVRLDTMDGADTVGLVVREPHGATCGEPYNNGSREPWWDRARYRVRTDVTVHVPATARFRVCGINSKTIDIAGVGGDFDVTNVNGAITVRGARGSGRATTVNGAVTVAFLDTPRDESLLKTVNGDITATFPASLSADLKLKTFHGGLFTDFDVTPVAARPTAAPDRSNGRYVYRAGGFTLVRAGRGGPEITLQTLNGDVRVVRATR